MTAEPEAPADLRLLWVTEHHPPSRGGMAQSSDRITRGLRRAGVSIDVLHLTGAPVQATARPGLGGAHLMAPMGVDPEHGLACAWLQVERHLARTGGAYSHVVAFGGTYALTAGPVYAAWLGVPLVSMLRGVDFDTGVFSLRRRAVLRDALTASARVCAVAKETARRAEALFGTPATWVANSIDTTDWALIDTDAARAADWRTAEGVGERRVLGLIGQLKAKKGAYDLLRCLAHSPAVADWHVLLVGEVGDEVEELLAAEPRIRTSRLGFLDRFELAWVYAACDVVALPSLHDGLPNVALEAAALGTPLLASDAGGLGDLVEAGAVAYAFPAGDWAACTRALVEAADATDDEIAEAGRRAAEVVAERFAPVRETRDYLRVLEETR
ncbi:hypothetical protein GCM10027418_17500 [Mariniluteicoccus endophyticus]